MRACLADCGLGEPTTRLVLAGSGGPDSTALLAACATWTPLLRRNLLVAHVDHGLQPDSARVAADVRTLCVQLGLRCRIVRLAGTGTPELRHGSEAWSRAGRYRLLTQLAQEEGAAAVLTAHHRDDQVETLLLRWLRGAGTRGLGAMARQRLLAPGLQLVRPFLELPRVALLDALAAAALTGRVVEDPSNGDRRFLRNQVRLDWLPALIREHGPEVVELLASAAGLFRQVGELMAEQLHRLEAEWVRTSADGGFALPLDGLLRLPPALRAALVLDLLHRLTPGQEPARLHVERILELALTAAAARTRSRPLRGWCLPGGARARIGRGELVLLPGPDGSAGKGTRDE